VEEEALSPCATIETKRGEGDGRRAAAVDETRCWGD
jgi:hypothetical protein